MQYLVSSIDKRDLAIKFIDEICKRGNIIDPVVEIKIIEVYGIELNSYRIIYKNRDIQFTNFMDVCRRTSVLPCVPYEINSIEVARILEQSIEMRLFLSKVIKEFEISEVPINTICNLVFKDIIKSRLLFCVRRVDFSSFK